MLAAERRGKTPVIDQEATALAYAEDVVTSTVFGLLSYLPAARGLDQLLRHLLPTTAPHTDVHLTFWPPGEGTEPDLVIEARHAVAVFEVKLDAPFGLQQLGREWLWLRNRVRERSIENIAASSSVSAMLVVVTRRPLTSAEIARRIAADLLKLGSTEPVPSENEIRCVTWHQLAGWMLERDRINEEPHVAAILDDLDYFMHSRGLRTPPFEAWPSPTRPWQSCPHWYVRRYFSSDELQLREPLNWLAVKPTFYQRHPT